jgi:mycothiol synthase
VSFRRPDGPGTAPTAFVQLLVVHPARRRRGIARRLLAEVERRAVEQGASAVQIGAAPPLYLYTGVDTRWTEALCCFEALGYSRVAMELDLVCSTRPARAATPRGVSIARVGSDAEVSDLAEWSQRCWPAWTTEFVRAAEAGTAVLARSGSGAVVGAAAHSVSRLGVVGPVAVEPGSLNGGIGSALMSAVLADLSVAGLQRAEIAWVSTVRFYVNSCGARVNRTSQVLRRPAAVPEPPVQIASAS